MTRTAWKAFERWIATRWGGERVPVTGRVRGYAPDVKHEDLAIEAKTRATIPAWLIEAIDQAQKARQWAEKRGEAGKIPIVVIHRDRTPYVDSIVLFSLIDAERLLVAAGIAGVPQNVVQYTGEEVS